MYNNYNYNTYRSDAYPTMPNQNQQGLMDNEKMKSYKETYNKLYPLINKYVETFEGQLRLGTPPTEAEIDNAIEVMYNTLNDDVEADEEVSSTTDEDATTVAALQQPYRRRYNRRRNFPRNLLGALLFAELLRGGRYPMSYYPPYSYPYPYPGYGYDYGY